MGFLGKKMHSTKLMIEGMTCDHCVATVTRALEDIDGVRKAKVDLKKMSADVKYIKPATIEKMRAAVVDAGYSAQ